MTQSANGTEVVKGFVVKLLKPKRGTAKGGGSYTISKFVLKLEDGDEVYASIYGDFDQNLVGSWIEVEGSWYNENNFNVDSEAEIVVLDEDAPEGVEEETEEEEVEEKPVAKKRGRGRPAGSTSKRTSSRTTSTTTKTSGRPTASKTTTTSKRGGTSGRSGKTVDRESFRQSAVDGTVANLQSAIEVLDQLEAPEYTVADLVAVADILGRTQTAIYLDHKNGK